MSEPLACAGPKWTFRIGRYRFMWETVHGLRKWGCSDGCRGVSCCWTPWGAFVALRRWQKQPARPA